MIKVQMPLSIRIERALDRPDTQAIMWGSVLLQILGSPETGKGADGYWVLSLYKYVKLYGDYSRVAITQTGMTAGNDPLFTTANWDLTLRPYYIYDTQPMSSYFRRAEPVVVFREVNSGVKNHRREEPQARRRPAHIRRSGRASRRRGRKGQRFSISSGMRRRLLLTESLSR